jgi:hypothetical protein
MAFLTANSYGRYVPPGGISRYELPPGHAGSIHTAERIRDLIKEGTASWEMRQFVMRLLRNVPEKDTRAEIQAIHEWVRNNLIYRKDPVGIDLVIGAPKQLEMIRNGISGFDCDDMVVFEGTMLRIAGVPVDLVIIKGNPRSPEMWSHIYLVAYDVKTGQAIYLDPIMKGPQFPAGWEAPKFFEKKIIPLDGLSGQFGVSGFGDYSTSGFGAIAKTPGWAFEHKRVTAHYKGTFPGFRKPYSGSEQQKWDEFIRRRRSYLQLEQKLRDAITKDIAKTDIHPTFSEQTKKAQIRMLMEAQDAKIKSWYTHYNPQAPLNISPQIKLKSFQDQNAKLTTLISELSAIIGAASAIDKTGLNYLQTIRDEQERVKRRAEKKQRNLRNRKMFRDIGAIALSTIPYVGMFAGMAGQMFNEMYMDVQDQKKFVDWVQKANAAAEAEWRDKMTALMYVLGKSPEIVKKLESIRELAETKIKLNNQAIAILQQAIDAQKAAGVTKTKSIAATAVQQVSQPVSVAQPKKPMSKQTKAVVAAAGTGAAGLLLWLLL